jgi:SAM-dependent methyltransferase
VETEVTEHEALLEERHWWFVGRRHLFSKELARLSVPPGARVLDVGSGTGSNVRLCQERGFGHCTGLDLSLRALAHAQRKGLGPSAVADVNRIPARSSSYDIVLATDIIEHVEDDGAAMQELARVARPGGHILLTVPAFKVLWGGNDDVSHHLRRYRRPQIRDLVRDAGLEMRACYYFNALLFAPVLVTRRMMRLLKARPRSEVAMTPAALNGILKWVFCRDVELSSRLHPPFGVSLLALVEKVAEPAPPAA